jgi:YhcH/YjgK/YiaL family protein
MIITHLNDAARYHALHPLFARAFDWLQEHAQSTLPAGRHEIDGESLFVMHNIGDGGEREGKVLEAHRRYIDIHYTIEGVEELGWKSTPQCSQRKTEYDKADDFELFNDESVSWSTLPPGVLAICFPEDAHAPLAGAGRVRKYVVKIAVRR